MSKKNKDIKMTIFIMVVGIGLIVAGIIGIITSRADSREYKNSTDIQKISKVTAEIYGTKTFLPENQKPFTKKIKKRLTLQRARNPEKRKTDGEFFTEKECPSCGANFMPDENGCCSYCGYTLHEDSLKWKIKS